MKRENTFRKWWQPPRKLSEREEERRVTFLELFYDLVYVVLIAQLAHSLAVHIEAAYVAGFVMLFAAVWIAWINGTFYHDLHGNNDIRTRVFTFAQMFAVATMAVFAHDALGNGSVGFALSFASYQLILAYLWLRTGHFDPDHKPLSNPYAFAFLLSSLLFAGSVFVNLPVRFTMWGIALLISLLLPIITVARRKNPDVQRQVELSSEMSPSVVERFGLLTIIVLGEVIVGVVGGLGSISDLDWETGIKAALGMLVAIGIWWIYFDFVSLRMPIAGRNQAFSWIYLHLPVTMGIVVAGAAVLNVVENTGDLVSQEVRLLLTLSVSSTLMAIAGLIRLIQVPTDYVLFYRKGSRITVGAGFLILFLGFLPIGAIFLLLAILALMVLPIVYGVRVWIRNFGAQDLDFER